MPSMEDRGGGLQEGLRASRLVLQVGPGGHEVAPKERHGSLGRLALQHEACIVLVVREAGELLGQRASGGQLGLGFMKAKEALEDLEALRRARPAGDRARGPGCRRHPLPEPPCPWRPSAAPPG